MQPRKRARRFKAKPADRDRLSSLPDELLLLIGGCLPARSVARLCQVSKTLRTSFNSEEMWATLCRRDSIPFDPAGSAPLPAGSAPLRAATDTFTPPPLSAKVLYHRHFRGRRCFECLASGPSAGLRRDKMLRERSLCAACGAAPECLTINRSTAMDRYGLQSLFLDVLEWKPFGFEHIFRESQVKALAYAHYGGEEAFLHWRTARDARRERLRRMRKERSAAPRNVI